MLALRAVATGCAVNSAWYFLLVQFHFPGVHSKLAELIVSRLPILLTQAVTGWVVARTHRAHAIPMVLVFAAWLAAWFLAGNFSEIQRLLVNSMDQPRFRPYLAWLFAPIITEVVGLLLGAVAGARPNESTSSPVYPEVS